MLLGRGGRRCEGEGVGVLLVLRVRFLGTLWLAGAERRARVLQGCTSEDLSCSVVPCTESNLTTLWEDRFDGCSHVAR
jgi:hypothetical protein